MKAPAHSAARPSDAEGVEIVPSLFADLVQLTKARLSLMVVFTTAIGYIVGGGGFSTGLLLAVLGTSLAACSAGALNQWMEVDVDRLMERTSKRPLPAARMTRRTAFWFGTVLGVLGVGILYLSAQPLAAGLALTTILVYLLLYTPLKRKSSSCTLVGAVSGALPPVIGWAAASPAENWGAWVLFGVLFLWQIPHFLAIAWMFKDEYRQAGFVMIKPSDEDGRHTAAQALLFAIALAIVAFVPVWLERVNLFYKIGAAILNLLFCGSSLVFLLERSRVSARRLFFMSIVYLPLALGLIAFARKP